jgi:hypothetical protein
MSRPSDYLEEYDALRKAVMRQAAVFALGSVVLAALTRSPSFELAVDPIGTGVHNGYVMVYGQIVILLLGLRYAMVVHEAVGTRDRILDDQKRVPEVERRFLNVEWFILRTPFSIVSNSSAERSCTRARVVQFVGILFSPIIAFVSYLTIMVEYFQCKLPG